MPVPHLLIDYSANLEDRIDIAGLCETLRLAAIETGLFPMPGVRVRAIRADHVAIADGDPRHGYLDISVRLRAGRAPTAKAEATQALFEAARRFVAPVMEAHPLALSLEMRDIDPDLSPKCGSIRAHLQRGPGDE